MRLNSEIATVQSIDKEIDYHTTQILRYQESIKGSRLALQILYKKRNYIMFGEPQKKPGLRGILSDIPYGESILLEVSQHRLGVYLKRVPGKKFRTQKEGTFTRVYCLPQ